MWGWRVHPGLDILFYPTVAILRFIIIIINIMPVISGRWEEDKYKAVCNRTATRPVHVLHVPSEGKVASMCVLRGLDSKRTPRL